MFWIVCSIISLIILKFTFGRNGDGSLDIEDKTIGNMLVIGAFILVSCIQFGIGIATYPSLSRNLAEIKALEKRIVDIKDCKYSYEKDGGFIAGSIENYQQSTNLSKFITDLAVKEARYNGNLKEAKITKEVFPLYFFSIGWAISDRIYELEEIGGIQ